MNRPWLSLKHCLHLPNHRVSTAQLDLSGRFDVPRPYVVRGKRAVATTRKPATGGADASSQAKTSADDPTALFRRIVGLKPLDTGPEREH